jgi:cell division protein ZipA
MNWNPDIGIPLAIAGILLLIAIAIFGRPRKPDQGRRVDAARSGQRRDPHWSEDTPAEHDGAVGHPGDQDEERALIERTLAADAAAQIQTTPGPDDDGTPPPVGDPNIGRRGDSPPQRIVTLFVSAREGQFLDGAAIVIAAEKAGLVYGHMGIFHRLADGKPEADPVFSVANLVKPGHFDLRNVHDIETPGLTFFMTLPGPLPALDAWETLLPTAQRMAELLDAVVLDEDRNTLGRQRIAHLRDDLRSFDREQEKHAQRHW